MEYCLYPIFVYDLLASQEEKMAGRRVTIVLNQQQLELLDRTIGKGAAPDRESLIKLAIRELAQARPETVR